MVDQKQIDDDYEYNHELEVRFIRNRLNDAKNYLYRLIQNLIKGGCHIHAYKV